jgi:hypothetical protein
MLNLGYEYLEIQSAIFDASNITAIALTTSARLCFRWNAASTLSLCLSTNLSQASRWSSGKSLAASKATRRTHNRAMNFAMLGSAHGFT